MQDVNFYKAFDEEAAAIRRHLKPGMRADFTSKTIQECGEHSVPARVVSVRTQSLFPSAWKPGSFAILTRSTGKTLGVFGVGHIGSEIVKIGQGLGMRVLPVDIVYQTLGSGNPVAAETCHRSPRHMHPAQCLQHRGVGRTQGRTQRAPTGSLPGNRPLPLARAIDRLKAEDCSKRAHSILLQHVMQFFVPNRQCFFLLYPSASEGGGGAARLVFEETGEVVGIVKAQ